MEDKLTFENLSDCLQMFAMENEEVAEQIRVRIQYGMKKLYGLFL
jgi:hypothetical protein